MNLEHWEGYLDLENIDTEIIKDYKKNFFNGNMKFYTKEFDFNQNLYLYLDFPNNYYFDTFDKELIKLLKYIKNTNHLISGKITGNNFKKKYNYKIYSKNNNLYVDKIDRIKIKTIMI